MKFNTDNNESFTQVIKDFFAPDNLELERFFANFQILKHGSREIFRASAKLLNEQDYSSLGTPTIDSFTNPMDRPLGYYNWYIAGYPDVVKWFSCLEEIKAMNILGNPNEDDFFDEESKIKSKYLKRMISAFKETGHQLECSSSTPNETQDIPLESFVHEEPEKTTREKLHEAMGSLEATKALVYHLYESGQIQEKPDDEEIERLWHQAKAKNL